MELRLKNVTSYNKNIFTNLDLSKKNKYSIWSKWLWEIYNFKFLL